MILIFVDFADLCTLDSLAAYFRQSLELGEHYKGVFNAIGAIIAPRALEENKEVQQTALHLSASTMVQKLTYICAIPRNLGGGGGEIRSVLLWNPQ